VTNYTKQQEGDSVVFLVTSAPYPKLWILFAIGGVIVLLGLFSGNLLAPILGAAVMWLGYNDPRPSNHRGAHAIRVSPDVVQTSSASFRKAEIEDVTMTTGYQPSGVLESIGASLGQLHKREVEEATGVLELRASGRGHLLIGGLDSNTAAALQADLKQTIRGEVAKPRPATKPPALPPNGPRWDSLILPEPTLTMLKQICDSTRAGKPVPMVLLTGPPGTGKTQVARTIASESGLPFLTATPYELRGSYIGAATQQVKALFDKAEATAPSVVFIDEFEAVAPPRNTVAADSMMQEVVSMLLARMDALAAKSAPVLLLAATNSVDRIDTAVRVRFARQIELPVPGIDERRRMLSLFLKAQPTSFDVAEIASQLAPMTDGMTGRDLRFLVERAAQEAVGRAVQGGNIDQIALTYDDLKQHLVKA
jgi:hypothetical protein